MTLLINSLSYERQFVPLFEELSLTLESGALLQVHGINGSGKTTFLRILSGFIEPTHGQIVWKDRSILEDREAYQGDIAYLGHLNGLKLYLTATENIKLMCALFQVSYSTQCNETWLRQVGLYEWKDKPAKYLSMGQQRRLSYVRLLLASKKIWFLDEPTTGIDHRGQRIFTDLLRAHLQQGGMAVVSTHHALSDQFSPRILELGRSHG